jgi:lysine-N-methylase
VKRIRSQPTEKNYARIELNPVTSACPMIEDHLCSVQKEMGEDKLSNTCFTYPRTTSVLGDVYQQALTLSCPEAARLSLLASDAFEFTETEISVRPETINFLKPALGLSAQQINEIRFFCIKLIQAQGLTLLEKLALMGLFCDTLTDALKANGQSRVADIIDSTQELLRSGQMKELLDKMQPNYEVQAITFALLWESKAIGTTSGHQLKVFKAVAAGLGIDASSGQVATSLLVERYQQGLKKLPEAFKDAPFFLENYILNEMWAENFPFATSTPLEHYLRLIIRFGLVRFMFAAQCSQEDKLPDLKTMTQTVQTFCRRYQHDTQFALNVNSCFENAGWAELQKIYKFLKT